MCLTLLNANPTKWSNTLKQFVSRVFDHFVKLALKGLKLEPKFGENALLALVFDY